MAKKEKVSTIYKEFLLEEMCQQLRGKDILTEFEEHWLEKAEEVLQQSK